MMTKPIAWLMPLALVGCSTMSQQTNESPQTPLEQPSAEQTEAIYAAEKREGFAGSWFEGGDLFIAFDNVHFNAASDLKSRHVNLVEVRHDLNMLEAAKNSTVRLIELKGLEGLFGVSIDKPKNRIVVDAVSSGQSSGADCIRAEDLPRFEPSTNVAIFNYAQCEGSN